MGNVAHRHWAWVGVMLAVGLVLPVVGYWWVVGRGPSVGALEVRERQLLYGGTTTLVWVDAAEDAEGLPRWPMEEILQAKSLRDVPAEFRDQRLLLLCQGGIKSAVAARHLQGIGVGNVFSVRGGRQEWVGDLPAEYVFHHGPDEAAGVPAFRASSALEQWAAVGTFFGVKFLYTVGSAVVIAILWRRREADLAALRWGMIFFFVGEACCFFNVMIFFEHSVVLEYGHNAGMVLTFAWTIWAVLEGLDARWVHFSDDGRCVAAGLCRGCVKHGQVACGLRRMFLLVIPATALLAALPWCSGFRGTVYNTRIFGVLHCYGHPIIEQIYELRYLPAAALVLLVLCFVVLWRGARRAVPLAKILFAAAAGALGFSFFRLVLVAAFAENLVWSDAWEEITELLYVGLAGGVLWAFRRGLLPAGEPRAEGVEK